MKSKAKLRAHKNSVESTVMPDITRRNKIEVDELSSSDQNSSKNEVERISPDVQTPDSSTQRLFNHKQIEKVTNVSMLPKKLKAMDPNLKMKIVSSKSRSKIGNFSNERDSSSPRNKAKNKNNERLFSKRLFAEREKTIANTNSLLTHGLNHRRSRAGVFSKNKLRSKDMSDNNDSQNMTNTIFPTIENNNSLRNDDIGDPINLKINNKRIKRLAQNSQIEQRQNHVKSVIDSSEYMPNSGRGSKQLDKREFSVDISKNSSEILRLLNILKKRKDKRDRKAWIPAGVAKAKNDGVSLAPKVFY